jgi:hypothetical protein
MCVFVNTSCDFERDGGVRLRDLCDERVGIPYKHSYSLKRAAMK